MRLDPVPATARKEAVIDTCTPRPALVDRPLIGPQEAERLGHLFKCLSHPSRLRMLHSLIRTGELSVGALADEAQMSRQAASNQLRTLADAGVVIGRQEGLKVFYRVIDPCVPVLLERGWCHVDEYDTVPAEDIEPN